MEQAEDQLTNGWIKRNISFSIPIPLIKIIIKYLLMNKWQMMIHYFNFSNLSKQAIERYHFGKNGIITDFQYKIMPYLLRGENIAATHFCGQGGTLAYVISIMERLSHQNWTRSKGTGAIIISPTRELALAKINILNDFISDSINYTCIVGGADRRQQALKLKNGACIVSATPERLLDHLYDTKGFKYDQLQMLILDQTDMILEYGDKDCMEQILNVLPQNKQIIMYSATLTVLMKDFIVKLFRKKPRYISRNKVSRRMRK